MTVPSKLSNLSAAEKAIDNKANPADAKADPKKASENQDSKKDKSDTQPEGGTS